MKLIKFYADWCQPCKGLTSLIQTLGVTQPIESVDVDTAEGKAQLKSYGISSIPAIVVVDGDASTAYVGLPKCVNLVKSLV